jgi:uncharacterized protein (TIGR00369 family)
MRQPP